MQIRKGNTMKLKKNHNRRRHDPHDSSSYVHHVPHNSKADQYRFYEDVVQDGNNIFEHEHIPPNNEYRYDDQHQQHHPQQHVHNNSLASMAAAHGRNNTFTKYLDDSLEVIDGDIPSQKEIMKDFFAERVNHHLQQQSSHFDDIEEQQQQQQQQQHKAHHIDVNKEEEDLDHFGGTMREIVHTPLDESDLINFNDMEDIDIPDYTDDDEEEKGIDPMQLIAAKNRLKSDKKDSFPDTQPITAQLAHLNKNKGKKRRRHNTQRSPIPQIGDITPSSVVIKLSDSDNDTYSGNTSDESEPNPASHRGSQRVLSRPIQQHALRSNTITNIAKLMQTADNNNKTKISKHRHSRSEVPKSFIKKNDLFNIYQRNSGHSAKAYFGSMTQIAKSTQSMKELAALKQMEKKYKPALEKTQQELDEARRKSLKIEREMNDMKVELSKLRKEKVDSLFKNETQIKNDKKVMINQKLRQKNLEIQELQSKLKFEKHRYKMIIPSYNVGLTPPSSSLLSTSRSANNIMAMNKSNNNNKSHNQLFEGLNRLKAKNAHHKQYISMKDLKKRKSLPEELAKKHKRPLWTKKRNNMKKAKTLESREEEENKIVRLGIKNRLIKKRESLLLPPNSKLIHRNLMKRNSWHNGFDDNKNDDKNRLKDILVAAQRKNANINNNKDELTEEYFDIKSKYQHLLTENENLRKENFVQKDELKKYKAPIPSPQIASESIAAPQIALIKTKPSSNIIRRKRKKNIIRRKRLSQIPKKEMIKMDWIPIEDHLIRDTQWKYIDDSDIVIPPEFEELFCFKKEKKLLMEKKEEFVGLFSLKKEKKIPLKRKESVAAILSSMKLSPIDIRFALLNVDESRLNRNILYNLLEIAPNLSELRSVQNRVMHNPSANLSFCEEFFYQLSDINHLELRVQLILFKSSFSDSMNSIYNDLFTLNCALKSIQRSSNFERILCVILSFGNFMNADAHNNLGIYGFELESLIKLNSIKNGDNCSFLSFICKFCMQNQSKYRNCLQIISELDLCHAASSIKSFECHQKILLITEELSKFGRSLRKFRKAAIPTKSPSSDNEKTENAAYKVIENDLFETTMREFARKAHLICKSLLDLHQEILNIADIIATQYNYNLNRDKIQDLLCIFSKFINNLKFAKNKYLREKEIKIKKLKKEKELNLKKLKLNKFLQNRIKPHFIYDPADIEEKEKEKEENIQRLSKLIYQHAILMDLDIKLFTVQRIKYLKGLAKSNELPNQLSNNPEAIQKERRRRRSLTNTDIQIGNKMAMTLAEDEEMK